MNIGPIQKGLEETVLTKDDFIKALTEELYRIPVQTSEGYVYPAEVSRLNCDSISVEMSDGSRFTLKIE